MLAANFFLSVFSTQYASQARDQGEVTKTAKIKGMRHEK